MSSCKCRGLLVCGKFNETGVLSIDSQIDFELLLPLWIKINNHLNDVGTRLKIELLESCSTVGLECFEFLDASSIGNSHIYCCTGVIVAVL